ncbi:vascular cell adhesion protein 1-like [Hemitrygon akajei]|uniref:vascular cell adhesion protein 1-like n=1 Tax=Hemitrygon akajei TaxID=2704970 RepID=UPI003BF9449B
MYFRSIFLVALLFVVTGKLNGYEVSVKANPPAVEFGHSLEVTCSTTCNNATIVVEYKPGKTPNSTRGDKWITDQFPSVQQWDFSAPCTVICRSAGGHVTKEDKLVVPVYNRNLSVVQSPDLMEVNKPYQLECTGPKVYPKNRLVLTWLRGREVVQRNYTWDLGFPEDGPLKNVINFTPSISDDGLVYTCLAELNLDSNTTTRIASSSVTLQVHYKPQNTIMSVNNKTTSESLIFLRKGDEAVMTCSSSGNPAVTIQWKYPHQGSKFGSHSSEVLRISKITSEHGGVYTCTATNQLGNDSRTVIISIKGVKDEKWKMALIITEIAFFLFVILVLVCCCMLCEASRSGSYEVQESLSDFN